MKFLFPNACLIYHLSNYKGDTLKHAIFTALFFIFVFYVLSCVSPGIDGRYAVDLEETKKNIVDERQKSIFSMVQLNMSAVEFEIKEGRLIWYLNGAAREEPAAIEKTNHGDLIVIDKNNDKMEFKYDGGRLLLMDPVMGIYIVFTKKQSQN
jgi:hypothetical protein